MVPFSMSSKEKKPRNEFKHGDKIHIFRKIIRYWRNKLKRIQINGSIYHAYQ